MSEPEPFEQPAHSPHGKPLPEESPVEAAPAATAPPSDPARDAGPAAVQSAAATRDTVQHESRPWHALTSFRGSVEVIASFLIAIILVRSFVVEGYLITSGSMAPSLLGYHKRVVCPQCESEWAYGVVFDESISATENAEGIELARCPICGQASINVTELPVSHGDQLLLHRMVFEFRKPRRWETVVFRSPHDRNEAYVKRVVGLPGERVRIVDGNILINGQLARKELQDQYSMRIPVADTASVAWDEDWEIPWIIDGDWTYLEGGVFTINHRDDEPDWMWFRHWRRSGGNHVTVIPLPTDAAVENWNEFAEQFDRLPVTWSDTIRFDDQTRQLECRGVMSDAMQQRMLLAATDQDFRDAIFRLSAQSHAAPVTDLYGYNGRTNSVEHPVAELMLAATLRCTPDTRAILVRMAVYGVEYELRIRPGDRRVELRAAAGGMLIRESELPPGVFARQGRFHTVEVSGFDGRLLIAIDEEQLMAPVDLTPAPPPDVPGPEGGDAQGGLVLSAHEPLAIGVAGGSVVVQRIQVFRDVFYTEGRARHGIREECRIAPGEYFVLGDNSPVSYDSRSWPEPGVPHRLLIGKPFLVHLPSRSAALKVGSLELPIRIPDFGRIRYIP